MLGRRMADGRARNENNLNWNWIFASYVYVWIQTFSNSIYFY